MARLPLPPGTPQLPFSLPLFPTLFNLFIRLSLSDLLSEQLSGPRVFPVAILVLEQHVYPIFGDGIVCVLHALFGTALGTSCERVIIFLFVHSPSPECCSWTSRTIQSTHLLMIRPIQDKYRGILGWYIP